MNCKRCNRPIESTAPAGATICGNCVEEYAREDADLQAIIAMDEERLKQMDAEEMLQ